MSIIFSVPYTGTQTAIAFLDYLGRSYDQVHAEKGYVPPLKKEKAVCLLRDPVVQFLSYRKRQETRNFYDILRDCVESWHIYTENLDKYDGVTLRIDGEPSQLVAVARHLGVDKPVANFGWPITNSYKNVTTIESLRSVSHPERKLIFDALAPYREIHGYNIDNRG